MSGRNVNIYFQEENYSKIEKLIKERRVSKLINQLVEEWDKNEKQLSKEELRQKMIEGYKQNAQNKKLQAELRIWDETVDDVLGVIDQKEKKNE